MDRSKVRLTGRPTRRTIPTAGQQLVASLRQLKQVLERGEKLEDNFIVHEVRPAIAPRPMTGGQVRALRERLNVSQAVLARLMAISVRTLQAWERGATKAPPMARRMLEAIEADKEGWIDLVYQRRRTEPSALKRRRAG